MSIPHLAYWNEKKRLVAPRRVVTSVLAWHSLTCVCPYCLREDIAAAGRWANQEVIFGSRRA